MTREEFLALPQQEQYKIYQEYKKTNTPNVPVPAGSLPGPFEGATYEQHPEISTTERLAAENFALKPEGQIEYLKSKHPNLEFRLSGGDVQVKSPKETSWKFVNPPMGSLKEELTSPKELAKDIAGHGYNIAVGAPLQIAGEALGAMGGGVPGAIAGAGVAGAGSEGLRQIIGEQVLGIPDNMSPSEVRRSALLSAAIPGVSSAFKGVAPAILSGTSGIPKDVIKTYTAQAPAINKIMQGGEGAKIDLANEKYSQIKNLLFQERNKVGKALEQSIDQAATPINISPLKQNLKAHILELELSPLSKSGTGKGEIADAKNLYSQLFGEGAEEIPDVLKPSEAFRLQAYAKEAADLSKVKPGIVSQRTKGLTPGDRDLLKFGEDAYRSINEYLNAATQGQSKELKASYQGLKRREEYVDKYFKDPEKTLNTLESIGGSKKDVLRKELGDIDSTYGTDFMPTAERLKVAKYFRNTGLTPFSGEGSTSTSRSYLGGILGTGPAAALGYELGGVKGAAIGSALGSLGSGPAATKLYSQGAYKFNQIPQLLRSGAAFETEENLKNADKNDMLKLLRSLKGSSDQPETQ